MTELTEQIEKEYRDIIAQVSEDILIYQEDLLYEGRYVPYHGGTFQIVDNLLHWVKTGLMCDHIKRFRIYRERFPRWQDYCQKMIGKASWQVKECIKAAKVVLELVIAGFKQLPMNISQALRLVRYYDKSNIAPDQSLLCEKWQQVISALPKHRITADNIDEVLGHMKSKKGKISIDRELHEKIAEEAITSGISTPQLVKEMWEEHQAGKDLLWGFPKALRDLIYAEAKKSGLTVTEVIEQRFPELKKSDESEEDQQEENEENVQSCTVSSDQIEFWQADLQKLVESHARDIWLSCCLLLKLTSNKDEFPFSLDYS